VLKKKSKINCFQCGVCCTVFEISSLNKPECEVCKYLTDDNLCSIYDKRPDVCKNFMPDEICVLISTLPKDEKLYVVKKIYGIKCT
jgi:Fe-S-cluster containining protein